jgi:hypothetical protein
MESFWDKINDICARVVTDPGDDMKKVQVVKGVIDDFYSFAAQETRKVSSWSDFCASMIDQATQASDIADFRQKRRAAITLELGKKRVRTGDLGVPEKKHPAGEDSANYASSHETEFWNCGKKGHKKYNCPKLLKKEKKEKKKKNDRKRKEKLRVRLDDSEASSSDSD